MKLVVVDVQPEYESNATFDIGDMLRSAAEDYSSVLFLFNGEDTLGMISEDALKGYYFEKLDYDEETYDELLSKSEFFDKGYGFFREVMDSDVCFDRNQVVKIVKYMLDNDLQDIRDLSEEDVEAIGVNELLFDDLEDYGFYVPELSEVLPNWGGSNLVGGARDECMAEVEILGAAQGLTFNHIDEFIYEGEKRYSEDEVLTETSLRNYIRELLTESAINSKIMSMIDRLEQSGGYIKITYNSAKVVIDGRNVAFIEFEDPGPRQGECSGAKIVSFSEAEGGYGPLAYDIAIEATGGLAPDRREVSAEAEAVWSRYESYRDDVKADQLDIPEDYDEPQLTPDDPSDDCEQVPAYDTYQDGWMVSPLSKKYSKSGTPVIDELRKRGMIRERK